MTVLGDAEAEKFNSFAWVSNGIRFLDSLLLTNELTLRRMMVLPPELLARWINQVIPSVIVGLKNSPAVVTIGWSGMNVNWESISLPPMLRSDLSPFRSFCFPMNIPVILTPGGAGCAVFMWFIICLRSRKCSEQITQLYCPYPRQLLAWWRRRLDLLLNDVWQAGQEIMPFSLAECFKIT